MSQHASSSKLENRAYVLLPPPPKRNSAHLDCTTLPVSISTRTVAFSPKKRQKISVEIKVRNLDKSQYSSLSGNLNGSLRGASPTISDWGRQHSPPVSPTISELAEPNSPLFSPTISEFNLEPYVDSSGQNSDIFSAELDGSLSTEDNDFAEPCDVVENASLKIPGEWAPSLDDPEPFDEDDIPVRRIDQFAIFRPGSREMVNITELLPVQMEHSGCQFLASGYISSWQEEEDDDSSDEEDEEDGATNASRDNGDVSTTEYSVELSTILELNVHALSPSRKTLDSKLYIRTKHAWYILGTPHRKYRRYYSLYWLQHRVLHIIVAASLSDARITFPRFLEEIPKAEGRYFPHNVLPCAQDIIGRELSEDDVKSSDIEAYVVSLLLEVSSGTLRISRVPLIRHFMGPLEYEFEPLHSQTSSKSRPKALRKQKPGKNVEINVLAHRLSLSKTFLTPVVNQLAERYFHGSLETAEQEIAEELQDNPKQTAKHKMHPYDPKNIVLGPYLDKGEHIYASVKLDNVQYKVGDVVMVAQDVNEKPNPNETSINPYANKYWFCQIQYIFQDGRETMFHAQWFNHGAKTLLQQMAHPGSLYYLGTCDDLPIGCIYKKANVTMLAIGDPEPPEESEESFNTFHCALQYDVDTGRFSDIPPNALVPPTPGQGKFCYACHAREAEDLRWKPQFFEDKTVLHYNGVVYHVKDHVYVHPGSGNTSSLLDICQIKRFDSVKSVIHVQRLSRMSEYQALQSKKPTFIDERELYLTDNKPVEVPIYQLDGVCFVKHLQDPSKIEKWIQSGDDHFFLNRKYSQGSLHSLAGGIFTVCAECHGENNKGIEKKAIFHKTNSKLVGMELFSGAGGLGLGMELSGAVSTKYAVEFSPSAAATFYHNHPNTEVFCQDTSVLLKRAVQRDAGDPLPTLYSNDGETVCPDLPSRTKNIDFIFGGPPCQSFSRANHSKKRDDQRSTLPCQMISWVEYYRPKYFLLENVGGIIDHVLYFRTEGDDGKSVEVEIRAGMVKFICRALIALGYQVHYRQLQAVQYGAPQSRSRVIFWGARRGIPLPEFPLPTRGGAKKATSIKLPNGQKVLPISRQSSDMGGHTYAPFRAVTVKDAIGDLPPFDWKNPATVMGLSQADHAETADRVQRLGIPQYDARNDLCKSSGGPSKMKDLPGYPDGAKYHTPPQNRYQKWLRRGMPLNDDVQSKLLTGHYTATFKPSTVEATVRVPLVAGASHKMLPRALIPGHALPETSKKYTLLGRMSNDEYFRCVLATVTPELKNAWPLHPEQRRIITVRECARAQGFPDHYVFISKNSRPHDVIKDQLRQIGNAVAVPFALALGKELEKVLIRTWEEHQREGSPEL